MSFQQAVPFGDVVSALEQSLAELPTRKVWAVVPPGADLSAMAKVRNFLSQKGISFETVTAPSDSADSFFAALQGLKSTVAGDALLVNVSVGTPLYSHIMLCAAMATGVPAFGVYDGKVVFLPISCSIKHGN